MKPLNFHIELFNFVFPVRISKQIKKELDRAYRRNKDIYESKGHLVRSALIKELIRLSRNNKKTKRKFKKK